MPTFFFTNVLMLAGMAALGIPVLIHLLLKRKKKRVPFSTIRFFQLQDEQSSRRRKLRNWLLLSLRLLIVALLVLAFSRPYARQSGAAAADRKRQRVVFVLDNSASMQASANDGRRWGVARQTIQRVLSNLNQDDSAALIECATHASVLSGFVPPASVQQMLQDLTPAYGTSTLSEGLQQAVRLLAGGGQGASAIIYLVSDLQKSACRSIGSSPVPQNIDVKVLPVGDVSAPNLAVVKLDAESHNGARPQVVIASFSDEDSPATTMELAIDNQRVSTASFSLKAGGSTNIDLVFPTVKPGWHDLRVSLRTRDALEADNSRYACFLVQEPAWVLLVEPQPAARSFEQESFFVAAALDPGLDSTNALPGAFKVAKVALADLPGKVASPNEGSPWNVVVLPGLKDLPAGSGKALASFVQAGGGLVLFLGEELSANRFNSELADLLPARIGDPDKISETRPPWRIGFYDTNSMVFSAFRLPNSGDLRIPEFSKRYTLESGEGSRRLAFFDDGVPLLVARSVGQGRVALVNTSADTRWTEWQKHKTFVPFLHGLTKFAAQTTTHESLQDSLNFIAGENEELETGTAGKLAPYTLVKPDGKEFKATADEQGRLQNPGMTLPGVYSLRDKSGHEIRRMAVNLPPQESDLEAMRPGDFQQQLARVQDNPKQTLAAGLFGTHNDRREYWTALLLGALVLLLVEPFVANRTSV